MRQTRRENHCHTSAYVNERGRGWRKTSGVPELHLEIILGVASNRLVARVAQVSTLTDRLQHVSWYSHRGVARVDQRVIRIRVGGDVGEKQLRAVYELSVEVNRLQLRRLLG
jgi:hypothetical protein